VVGNSSDSGKNAEPVTVVEPVKKAAAKIEPDNDIETTKANESK